MCRRIGFIYFYFFVANVLVSQTTISGRVYNSASGEGIPFAIVLVIGTEIGTSTDFDGNYKLGTKSKCDSLQISYTGYESKKFALVNGAVQVINAGLQVEGVLLDDVTVRPGENPANKIIREVIANKVKNNKKKLEAYQYEVYNKLEFDLNNIPPSLKNKKAFKSIRFIFDDIDSSNSNGEKPFLPIFMVENLSEFFFRDNPKMKKEIIKASRLTGVENSSISQVMGDMYQNINIYDNNILIFGKEFISPISENAIFYYKFYLEDSLFVGNTRCYQIRFKPKRKQELLFSGNMWIADTTFGLKRIEMTIPQDANINFISSANMIQEYNFIDNAWMLKKDRLIINFSVKEKSTGIYGRKTTSYKDIIINKPKPESFFKFGDNVEVLDSSNIRDDKFWEDSRHDSLSRNEKLLIKRIDTIQTLTIYKTWLDVLTIIVSGYAKIGFFEIGPYSNLASYNQLEGPRFRFGGRTTNKFSRRWEFSAYGAYGTKDEKFKYGTGFRTLITRKPIRQLCGADYKSDLEILGQSQNGFTQDNLFASFFRRTPLNSLTKVNQINIWYEREWVKGLTTKLSLINRKLTPVGGLYYSYNLPNGQVEQKVSIITSEIRVNTRFAFDEKHIDLDFSRTSLGTKYPVLQLNYIHSIKNVFQSSYEYQKIVLKVDDRIRIGSLLGYTDYTIEAGQYFGQIPYPLMELHGGNTTIMYDYMAYNLMNYYEFVSDKYASIWLFHHFEGLLFNKIPFLRKLKWREVLTYKALIGSVNIKNKQELNLPSSLHTLEGKPYHEVSVGIENIFKLFRVDAFWRLSYRQLPNAPKWGAKLGFQLSF